jgi:UDP-apiose/xylose synthase
MRIAVLGAGGFVGSHLVPALLQRFDCAIDAVDVDFHKLQVRDPRVQRISARVEQPGLAEQLSERCELVISLTALCNPAQYNTIPLAVIDESYTHLLPIVRACAARNVHLLHFSTSEVYGRCALDDRGERTLRMNEDETAMLLGPVQLERWTYACAKQLLERVIWAHGRHGRPNDSDTAPALPGGASLPFTIVRLFNTIGPRMDYLPGVDGEGVPRVLAAFMNALLRDEELLLVDGGQQRRAFMGIADLVDAIVRMVERRDALRGEIVNLGNPDNDVSIAELATMLSAAYAARVPSARPARMRVVSARELYGDGYDDSHERIPDIAKAQRLLGWQPRQSLRAILPAIVDDYVTRYGARVGLPSAQALLPNPDVQAP